MSLEEFIVTLTPTERALFKLHARAVNRGLNSILMILSDLSFFDGYYSMLVKLAAAKK